MLPPPHLRACFATSRAYVFALLQTTTKTKNESNKIFHKKSKPRELEDAALCVFSNAFCTWAPRWPQKDPKLAPHHVTKVCCRSSSVMKTDTRRASGPCEQRWAADVGNAATLLQVRLSGLWLLNTLTGPGRHPKYLSAVKVRVALDGPLCFCFVISAISIVITT